MRPFTGSPQEIHEKVLQIRLFGTSKNEEALGVRSRAEFDPYWPRSVTVRFIQVFLMAEFLEHVPRPDYLTKIDRNNWLERVSP